MKATDLMLGDWVQNEDGIYLEVIGFDVRGIFLDATCDGSFNARRELAKRDFAIQCVSRDGDLYNLPEDDIYPIPLTREILQMSFPSGAFRLLWHQQGTGFFCETVSRNDRMASGEFHYVHELQHALHLCDIGQAIELGDD